MQFILNGKKFMLIKYLKKKSVMETHYAFLDLL